MARPTTPSTRQRSNIRLCWPRWRDLARSGLRPRSRDSGGLGSISCATMNPHLAAETIQTLQGLNEQVHQR